MFDENINQSLFNNNVNDTNVSGENSIPNEDEIPPVLDEIKGLNESTNLVAPTKNALGEPMQAPQSYFSRNIEQDKLEQYENNETSFSKPVEEAQPYSSLDEYNSEQPVLDTNLDNSLYSNPIPEPPISGILDTKVPDINVPNYEEHGTMPEENYNEEISQGMESNFVSEPSILDAPVDTTELPKEDYKIVDDMSLNNEEEIKTPMENQGNIEETLSQDQLEVDEMIDPDEKIDDTLNLDNQKEEELTESNDLDDIKNIVENMKSKGMNVRIEEFDFETIHQMIIIIEK